MLYTGIKGYFLPRWIRCKHLRTRLLTWKFFPPCWGELAWSADFSAEVHLNPRHFSLSGRKEGLFLSLLRLSLRIHREFFAVLPWSGRDGGFKGIPVLFHWSPLPTSWERQLAIVPHVISKFWHLRCFATSFFSLSTHLLFSTIPFPSLFIFVSGGGNCIWFLRNRFSRPNVQYFLTKENATYWRHPRIRRKKRFWR